MSQNSAVLTDKERSRQKMFAEFKRTFSGWLIMLPSLLLFVFFIWWPLLFSVRLSLFHAQSVNLTDFVGFDNYFSVVGDVNFWPAFYNTLAYTGWSLLIGFLVPIVVAVLVNEMVHCKGLFRIGTYVPNVVPQLATVVMWTYIYSAGSSGVLNIILSKFGIANQPWLQDARITKILIVVALTWKGFGSTMLIYLASLQGINQELYEAAAIDGAGIWNRIRYITVPNLYGVAKTLLILQIISVFQILYEPMVMTGGGPGNAAYSIMMLVYNYAFKEFNYPKASAVSIVICIMLVAITAIYNNIIKDRDM